MPRGDRTGPVGLGPMTGRAAGYCGGYGMPGFMNPYGGRAAVRGFPFGLGRGPGPGPYGYVAAPYAFGPFGRWGRGFGFGRGGGRGRGRGFYRFAW
ncbi:MAG: DUF5320 domain-containing protein [Dehalococcoidia bacterium]